MQGQAESVEFPETSVQQPRYPQHQQYSQQEDYRENQSINSPHTRLNQKRPLEGNWSIADNSLHKRSTNQQQHLPISNYSNDASRKNTTVNRGQTYQPTLSRPPVGASSGYHPNTVVSAHIQKQQQQQQPALPIPMTAFSLLTKSRQQEAWKTLYIISSPNTIIQTSSASASTSASTHHTPTLLPAPAEWLRLGLGITELAGEAGSGKSQIAMSLCVQAVLQQQQQQQQHTNGTTKAIYISLAGGQASLSRIAHRMSQISDARLVQQQQQQQHATSQRPSESVLSQILTHSIRNHDDLFTLLREDLPARLQGQALTHPPHHSHPVALIVLDSIADLFRLGNGDDVVDVDKTAIAQRSYRLFEIAALLRALSDQYGIPVLVVNQVSSNLSNDLNTSKNCSSSGKSSTTIPTLGLSWANCVNTSYLVRRKSEALYHRSSSSNSTGNGQTGERATPTRRGRQLFLTKSSTNISNRRALFEIERRGVVPVDR